MQDLDRIYQDNFIKVYRYILSISGDPHLAEDITQEVFLKLHLLIMNNTRSQNYLKQHPPEDVSSESIEQELIRKEQAVEIIAAMQKLDDPYKEVFSLRTFSDLSFKEIGKMFGKNDSWARVTYHRAKLKVKEELKDEY